MKFQLSDHKRIVIKIGSALIVDTETGDLRDDWLSSLVDDLAQLASLGKDLIIVSSGAIALGRFRIGLEPRPLKLEESQAAASVGQIELARIWSRELGKKNLVAGQVLLTLDDTEERRRYLNARSTLEKLVSLKAIPVINENDTVATSEIKYGDNDRLAARVASMVGADCLVLLSDVDGLYTAPPGSNPDIKHIPLVEKITPEIISMAGSAGTALSRGGMKTKIEAAKIATDAGANMVISSGKVLNPIAQLDQSGVRQTWFRAATNPKMAWKSWIAGSLKTKGTLVIDDGAAIALRTGKSLLPAGLKSVEGSFQRGDAVWIRTENGGRLAQGLTSYDSTEAAKLVGCQSADIEKKLGYPGRGNLVHRDNLAMETDKS